MEQLLITFALVAFFVFALGFKIILDGKSGVHTCSSSKSESGGCGTCSTPVDQRGDNCDSTGCETSEKSELPSCSIN